jgi:hypothetical protein
MSEDRPRRRSTRRSESAISEMTALGDFGKHDRNDLRDSIAHAAARLIAEGLDDYHAAKIKAAKQLGLDSRDKKSLPDNQEIEAALREHHALFNPERQAEVLAALREAALRAMQWLAHFEPWLTGGVLTGTANEYSAIELELVGVEPKSFEMFLLNEDVEFDSHDVRVGRGLHSKDDKSKSSKSPHMHTRYEITFDDAPVEITLFDSHSERQAMYPKESVKHDRAQWEEAQRRFAE